MSVVEEGWREREEERMEARMRKRYSPNDFVKCHISAQRRGGGERAILTEGVTGRL